jgi:DNA mismatch repair protein MutS
MSQVAGKDDTPAMRQYRRFKEQYPQCVLFFRMGDFYEMFYEDAQLAHKVLGVTLTQRTEGIPMAGVPYHAVEGYLRRMIQAGYRVAVCEQVEDPAQAKGVVQRDVTRVITPGTITDESLLDAGRENPLAAVQLLKDGRVALAWAELSTGSFRVALLAEDQWVDEMARINASELLYPDDDRGTPPPAIKTTAAMLACVPTPRPPWHYRAAEALEILQKQFGVASLSGFGLSADDPVLGPAAAVIEYLRETQRNDRLTHLQPPRRFARSAHLVIDSVSLRSLEIERTLRSGGVEGSLLGAMQDCVTAMGKRSLRQWLCYPLSDRAAIEARQDAVATLVNEPELLTKLRAALDSVQDVQRILARMAVNRALPRDLVGLGTSARQARALADLLDGRPSIAVYHQQIAACAAPLESLAQRILAACVDAPPQHLREGGLIRDGVDAPLDEFRMLQRDSHTWLAGYQKSLIEQTGIHSLKVGYNKVFGYYIEVTAANAARAPDAWSRKQTLKNAERYITPQLKEYEDKVLGAEQKAIAREQELFAELCAAAQEQLGALQAFAQMVGDLDVLCCFARRAARHRYVRPQMVEAPVLHIAGGRHPVLDALLGDQFVPNDVSLGGDGKSGATLALITGPNMAGKSTYIRQAALITLLAHTGSFVPAEDATVGLCDRIFTRIGASDELHAGQSTFMVEMTETANICHHASAKSLVILDEIGRGTSTLDGLSLAWAIAEHLAGRRCRTLFATHYHEITALDEQYPQVTNLNVTVREWQDQIVFLHRIVPGATDRSYGIHVAKIAGLPREVVQRAHELMAQLEVSHHAAPKPAGKSRSKPREDGQLSLFTEYLDHPALEALRQINLDAMTPMQAFDALRQLRQQAQGK